MHLLFDIGGTHLRVGISTDGKNVDQWQKIATPPSFEDGMKQIESLASELSNKQPIRKVTGGIAGILNAAQESLLWAPNLPEWVGQPFKNELTRLFNCPIQIQNDAALAGLGEAHYGAGKGHNIIAYLTVSTGVGGCRIVNGKIDTHTYGFEPGQQIIDMSGLTLEKHISGAALSKKFNKPVKEITEADVWRDVEKKLAFGLVTIIALWSPDIVVIGGGLIDDQKRIVLQNVAQHVQEVSPFNGVTLPALVPAQLGDTNGLWGALTYA